MPLCNTSKSFRRRFARTSKKCLVVYSKNGLLWLFQHTSGVLKTWWQSWRPVWSSTIWLWRTTSKIPMNHINYVQIWPWFHLNQPNTCFQNVELKSTLKHWQLTNDLIDMNWACHGARNSLPEWSYCIFVENALYKKHFFFKTFIWAWEKFVACVQREAIRYIFFSKKKKPYCMCMRWAQRR
jgi:hypothetical protein